ncbi:MAG: glycosyltransferase, partial [bacterium]
GTEAYKNRLQQLDKKGLVYFHGRYELEHLPNLLRQVDVTVIPSICEDCAPFVVQESLAARCPVIGSRIGGIPEFIDECVNGFIFEPGDSSSLTNILHRFIQDPTLLERLQNKIQPPRSFDDYLDLLIDYYNEEISKNGLNLKSQSSTKKELSRKVHAMVNTPKSHSAKNNRGRSIRQKYSLYHIHGREEILKEWMSPYADIFIGCTNVLDVGCGPGLFLELLKDRGIPSIGFDHDPDMIDICHTKNLNAKLADERTLFADQEEFDGIHLGHVIEHMDGPAMLSLLESCVTALGPGGLLLIRTPNWQNESVRNGGFWLDYTHVRPYPLELLERIYLDLGLEIVNKGYEPNGWNDIYILGKKQEKIKSKKQSQIKAESSEFPALSIVWEGSQFVYHSLALINRELCLKLMESGYELSIIPYESDQFTPDVDIRFQQLVKRVQVPLSKPIDIHVRHQWPPNLTPPKEGHWVIIQPWEFGSLPKQWVEVFSNQVDELWVPSQYLRQVYVDSGVPSARVYVVPNGIHPDKFHPGVKPIKLRTKKKFKFLFVGGTIERKGVDLLLEAYVNAFKKTDDVCLVIKDMGGDSFYKGITFRDHIRKLKRKKNVPAIEYIDRIFPEEKLAGLYAACDVLVHPYRGEGFGLPILEAMACGIPAIVTNGGACLDFCNSGNSLLVNAKKRQLPEKRVGALKTVGYPWIYEVAMDDLKRKMLFAFQHPAQMKALGKQASQEILKQWTWEHSAKIIAKRLALLKNLPLQRTDGNKNIDLLFQKGRLLVKKGNLVAGLKVLSQLLELKPNHCATLKLMGDLYQQLGKESEAHQMWDLALAQQSTNQKPT